MTEIHKKVLFNAPIDAVYKLFTDSGEFSNFSGMEANITLAEGGQVSLFSGYIQGYFLKLFPNQRIVMAWRDDYSWSEGDYSVLDIKLEAVEEGTEMTWDQYGIPQEEVDHMSRGVERKYFTPMADYLASGAALTEPTPNSCQVG